MIVGDSNRFGIEFEVDAEKLDDVKLREWIFGRLRWWCGGEVVGRYDADTTLRDVASEAKRFLASQGTRQDDELMNASGDDVVRILVRALYDDHGQSDQEVEADEARYRRFVVKPQVDVFGPWDIFLVDGKDYTRLVWRRVGDAARETILAPGEFDAVLKAYVEALRQLVEQYGRRD